MMSTLQRTDLADLPDLPEPEYEHLAATLRVLAHGERLRILDAVRRDAECVCHLEALLGKPQPYVSQQLRVLREAGLIADVKQGQNVYYYLKDPAVRAWLATVLGPATGELPALAGHKRVIACPCPKCNDDERFVPLSALEPVLEPAPVTAPVTGTEGDRP